MKKLYSFLIVLLIVSVGFAKTNHNKVQKAPKAIIEKNNPVTLSKAGKGALALSANSILIGKTWNSYTTQSSYTNEIYFDTYSKLIGVNKRTDKTGAGSGRIVYQVSDDLGKNWSPQSDPVNPAGYMSGRHPSFALSNPTKSNDLTNVGAVNIYASLGSTWRYAVFATDASPLTSSFTWAVDSVYAIPYEPFVNANGDVFSSVAYQELPENSPSIEDMFVTRDKGLTWSKFSIADTNDFNGMTYNGIKGDFALDGNGYAVVEGVPYTAATTSDYDFGYKHTSDNGVTFDANWTWVNYKTVPYAGGGVLGDRVNGLNYDVDVITFGKDNLMMAGAFITADSLHPEYTGIYVISKVGSTLKAQQIRSLTVTSVTLPGSGALTALNEPEFARSEDGGVVALKFIDFPTKADTAFDVFVSWYNLDGTGKWTTPENVTNTPNVNEKQSETASRLYYDEATKTYQLLPMYTLFGLGDTEDSVEGELYFLDGIISPVATAVENNNTLVNKYTLDQNYPNPFNPSTLIKYNLAKDSKVTLKVYDMLGREVSVLVNSIQQAGNHQVNFNASNLSSGVYTYTLSANDFTTTKKMMLLK